MKPNADDLCGGPTGLSLRSRVRSRWPRVVGAGCLLALTSSLPVSTALASEWRDGFGLAFEGKRIREGGTLDLGTVADGEWVTSALTIHNPGRRPIGFAPSGFTSSSGSFVIEGRDVVIAPLGEADITIRFGGLSAPGQLEGQVVVESMDGDTATFVVGGQVVDDAIVEDFLEDTYQRFASYTQGAEQAVRVDVFGFETFDRAELEDVAYDSFITFPGGDLIEVELTSLGEYGNYEAMDLLDPEWIETPEYDWAADPYRDESVGVALDDVELSGLEETRAFTRATRFWVEVEMGEKGRVYRAVLYWGGGSTMLLVDMVTRGVELARHLERPPAVSPSVVDSRLREYSRSAGRAPVPRADALDCVQDGPDLFSEAWLTKWWATDHNPTGSIPVAGRHGLTGRYQRTCDCVGQGTTTCRSFCRTQDIVGWSCREIRDAGGYWWHSMSPNTPLESTVEIDGGLGVACGTGYVCAVRFCAIPLVCTVELGFSLGFDPTTSPFEAGFKINLGSVGGDVHVLEQRALGGRCPTCLKVFAPKLTVTGPVDSDHVLTVSLAVEGQGEQSWDFSSPVSLYPLGRVPQGKDYSLTWQSPCLDCDLVGSTEPDGTAEDALVFRLACRESEGLQAPLERDGGSCQPEPSGVSVGLAWSILNATSSPDPVPSGSVDFALLFDDQVQDEVQYSDGEGGLQNFQVSPPSGTDYTVEMAANVDQNTRCTFLGASGGTGGPNPSLIQARCVTSQLPDTDDCAQVPVACDQDHCDSHWVLWGYLNVTYILNATGQVIGGQRIPVFVEVGDCYREGRSARSAASAPFSYFRLQQDPDVPWPRTDVLIQGVARDDEDGIRKVEIRLNGQAIQLENFQFNQYDRYTCQELDTPNCDYMSAFSGTLDLSQIPPGRHNLTAYSESHDGQAGFAMVELWVASEGQGGDPGGGDDDGGGTGGSDCEPVAFVELTQPAAGSGFEDGDSVSLVAEAPTDGTVQKVMFLADGALIRSDFSPPYEATWTAEAGVDRLTARAYSSCDPSDWLVDHVSISVEGDDGGSDDPPTCSTSSVDLVQMTSPIQGAELTEGTVVSVAADAEDADGIDRVDFASRGSNGGWSSIGSDETSPFVVHWVAESGVTEVKAVAYDECGYFETSAVAVSVPAACDGVLDHVELTGPPAGSELTEGSQVTITADASDAAGIERVSFRARDEEGVWRVLGVDTSPPFAATWTAEAGYDRFKVIALDNCGQVAADSHAVSVVPLCDGSVDHVNLFSPSPGSSFPAGETVELGATAADFGGIQKVLFLARDAGGVWRPVSTDFSAPYEASWVAVSGYSGLKARAYESCGSGFRADSHAISVP